MLKEITICGREHPMGLDQKPRFSWKITSALENVMQESYQILVRDKEGVVWDSGRIQTATSIHVPYDGKPLSPCQKYDIFVSVLDNRGESHEGSTSFETGLLSEDKWQAEWITHSLAGDETAPAVFCKTIQPVRSDLIAVRIYASALGVYDILANGSKLGDAFLSPGWTSYPNRLQYQTYDATEAFTAAGSEGVSLRVPVANGWYAGYLNCEGKKGFYGNRTALLMMVRLEYADGSVQVEGTDGTWTVTTGTVRYAELYHGETQDLTIAEEPTTPAQLPEVVQEVLPAVDPAVDPAVLPAVDPEVLPAEVPSAPVFTGHLIAQQSEPVRVTQRIAAANMFTTPRGETVIDFGQNMAGIVEITLPPLTGNAGVGKLVLRHAETLDRDGNFYTENLRTARATDTYLYTADQVGRRVHPHFTYHGFRYISVEAQGTSVRPQDYIALVLLTDMRRTGTFECDNDKINRLYQNILWGMKSNFVDIPTDCPQRDERLGWTGDAQIFCATGAYLYDTESFFHKWLTDVAAESDAERGIPHLVPNIAGEFVGTSVWGDCATVIPWELYEAYGDETLLREHYPLMKLWTEYIRSQCGGRILWLGAFQRGDWLALDAPACRPGMMKGGTDRDLVANVYYALAVRLSAQAARVLGYEDDAKDYQALYEEIREELNEEYVTRRGRLVTETQTACALLLHFDLLKQEYRDRVLRSLETNLMDNQGHLTTGFVGTAFLCHALTENGRHDLAEKVFLQTDYPGWLYQVGMGATTIWERWNSVAPDGTFDQSGMNSLNHYAYGAIGDWMHKKIAGIQPLKPGYQEILIRPYLTHGMTQVAASLETPYGLLAVKWICREGEIRVDVTIPVNTTAHLFLPEQEGEILLGSGCYHYRYPTKTQLLPGRFCDDTRMEDILSEPAAADILYEVMPEMRDNPMLGYIRTQTIGALKGMSDQTAPVLDEVVRRLNAAGI